MFGSYDVDNHVRPLSCYPYRAVSVAAGCAPHIRDGHIRTVAARTAVTSTGRIRTALAELPQQNSRGLDGCRAERSATDGTKTAAGGATAYGRVRDSHPKRPSDNKLCKYKLCYNGRRWDDRWQDETVVD